MDNGNRYSTGQRHKNEKVWGVARGNHASAEGTKLTLHLSNIPAIPFADPTLIVGGHGARRKNGRWKFEKALPLGARAHRCAAPPIALCGRSRACHRSRVVFKAILVRGLEHELRWYFLP